MSILLNTAAKNLIKWDVTVQLEVDIKFINLSCAALHLYITMQDLLLTRSVSKMILLGTGNPTWGTSDSVLHLQLFLYIQIIWCVQLQLHFNAINFDGKMNIKVVEFQTDFSVWGNSPKMDSKLTWLFPFFIHMF